MHHPAGAFQANHHLIARFRRRQYRGDLFPQAIDLMGIHTAFEIQHPGARLAFRLGITQLRPRFGRLRLLFLLFLLRLMPLLLLRAVQQRHRQRFLHLFVMLAKIGHPQFAALLLALSEVDDNSGNHRDGDDNRRDLG